jgi:hypothetical protein
MNTVRHMADWRLKDNDLFVYILGSQSMLGEFQNFYNCERSEPPHNLLPRDRRNYGHSLITYCDRDRRDYGLLSNVLGAPDTL